MFRKTSGFGKVLLLAALVELPAALAAPVEFATLPLQAPPRLPDVSKRPEKIPKNEPPPGLFVGDRRSGDGGSYAAFGFFTSEELARAFEQDPYGYLLKPHRPGERHCFVVAGDDVPRDEFGEPTVEWGVHSTPHAEIPLYSGAASTVAAIRMERFVSDLRGDRLEATEFWVDPRTLGTQIVGTSTLALTRIAEPAEGISVYVARTGEARAEVVVRREASRAERSLGRHLGHLTSTTLIQSGVSTTLDGTVGQSSTSGGCGHVRFHLESDTEERRQRDLERFGSAVAGPDVATIATGITLALEREAGPDGAIPNRLATRPVTIQFGLSRLANDPAPILSVSYRWTAPRSTVFLRPLVVGLPPQDSGERF